MSKICKNCGIENDVNAKYCSECGQSLSVGRLQPKTFFAEIMSGLLRLNRGMLFTSWNLLIHPWKVIRDYIHGKRISYTPPVNLLILLMFILALLEKFGLTMSGIVVKESVPDDVSDASLWYRIGLSVSSMFEGPSAFFEMLLYIPALIAVWLVYRKYGSKKYNVAEYLAAALYMACAIEVCEVLVSFLSLFMPENVTSPISYIYMLVITLVSLYHAFPMKSRKKRVRHYLYFCVMVGAIYFGIMLLFGILYLLIMGKL